MTYNWRWRIGARVSILNINGQLQFRRMWTRQARLLYILSFFLLHCRGNVAAVTITYLLILKILLKLSDLICCLTVTPIKRPALVKDICSRNANRKGTEVGGLYLKIMWNLGQVVNEGKWEKWDNKLWISYTKEIRRNTRRKLFDLISW